jgi:hypothetical protein
MTAVASIDDYALLLLEPSFFLPFLRHNSPFLVLYPFSPC